MNHEITFGATEYGEGNGHESVALVTGLAGSVNDLEQAAMDLSRSGRDSVVYTYPPDILLDGNPHLLPSLINTLSNDFNNRTDSATAKRFGGVSLGGAVAAGMQKLEVAPETGLYAASGCNAAELVMKNLAFSAVIKLTHRLDIKKVYTDNGHSIESLNEVWSDIHTTPDTPFTLAIGGLDIITRRHKIMKNIREWRKTNDDIKVINLPFRGHNGTISWYNQNITSLLPQQSHLEVVDY